MAREDAKRLGDGRDSLRRWLSRESETQISLEPETLWGAIGFDQHGKGSVDGFPFRRGKGAEEIAECAGFGPSERCTHVAVQIDQCSQVASVVDEACPD